MTVSGEVEGRCAVGLYCLAIAPILRPGQHRARAATMRAAKWPGEEPGKRD